MFDGADPLLAEVVPIGVETPDLSSVRAVGDTSPNWDKERLRNRTAATRAHTLTAVSGLLLG